MTGRRLGQCYGPHYYDDWCPGWRQVLRKRIHKRFLRRRDRRRQKSELIERMKDMRYDAEPIPPSDADQGL